MQIVYFAIISLALFASLGLTLYRNKRFKLPEYHVLNLFIIGIIAGLACARLFHVFYEEWAVYRDEPALIFKFWVGGYVYYAGIVGGLLAGAAYLKFQKQKITPYLNLFIVVISLGSAIGRLACLFAGCCYGKYCELPWAIEGRHPTQLYSFAWEMVLFTTLLLIEKRGRAEWVASFWFIGHGLGRLIVEQYRDDYRGEVYLMSISSWISVAFIAFGIYWLIRNKKLENLNHK